MTIPAQVASVTNPFSGVFGNGDMQIIPVSGTFTVPLGVSRVRVRLWGAGGAASVGGGGGGFAMRVIQLGTTTSVAVTVGAPSAFLTGGTSSFGAFVSAIGGTGGGPAPNSGGSGVGGDLNFTGGAGSTTTGGAGGGVASLFGNGGNGATVSGPGGIGGSGGGGGATVGVPGGNGIFSTGGGMINVSGSGIVPTSGMISPSIDLIGTGGGGSASFNNGVNGGGSSGSGFGGFPGGGSGSSGGGGRGLVIVEY